ncbi:MAG: sigma-54 dependent transcriptional regulator [Alphaproteobacteria bacterium]
MLLALCPTLPPELMALKGLLHCDTLDSALATAAAKPITLMLAESQYLPALFAGLKDQRLSTPVVAFGPAQPATGAKAIRLGAIEYLTTPLDAKLLEPLMRKAAPPASAQGPVAGDPKTLNLLEQARHYAASDATVLLRGESGTGKEVFARTIHTASPRKDGPFIAVNCAAIPENLLESELFGHEKGAFSGALAKRLGKFQQAEGGTLLLDEISEMDLGLQAKLLRAIQERVVDPVGADKPVPINIRLIATTNRQLEHYVAEGKFREDLYFRLNVVMLEIPPLRERTGDILPLARHFAARYAASNNYPVPSLSALAEHKLHTCYWKGNVRELENTLHRAVLLAGKTDELDDHHIIISPMSMQMMSVAANTTNAAHSAAPLSAAAAAAYGGKAPVFIPKRLAEAEKDILVQTLTFTHGNRDIAADILGISVVILKDKLAALGLN